MKDIELIKQEIKRRIKIAEHRIGNNGEVENPESVDIEQLIKWNAKRDLQICFQDGKAEALKDLLSFIESLEQEPPFPNWRDINKEKPKSGQNCACITVTVNDEIKYNNFECGPWWWDADGHYAFGKNDEPGVFVGSNDWGDRETHSCSYWMPWEELFDTLEKPLKDEANDR